MKHYLRVIITATIAFFVTYNLIPSIALGNDPKSILIIVGGLFIISQAVHPLFSIVLLPINHLTFGLLSFILNAVFFFVLPRFLTDFEIASYNFPGADINGFILPQQALSPMATTLLVAALVTLIQKILRLIFD